MKTGLVLEGGAMRGMFTAGVLDVLMEHGVTFDGLVGVSAGAAFGCNFKSHQIGRSLRYNLAYSRDWRYCSFRSLLRTGDLYGADFCYRTIPEELDLFDNAAFERNTMPFYVVCTDAGTGEAVYHRLMSAGGQGADWIRASASMPIVSRAVEIGGRKYLDGGISDSIPLAFMEREGYAHNVVVLTQPAGYRKEPLRAQRFLSRKLREFPRVAETMRRRYESYNHETAYVSAREASGDAFVIRPPQALGIRRTESDPRKLLAVYETGRQTMLRRLAELEEFLGKET